MNEQPNSDLSGVKAGDDLVTLTVSRWGQHNWSNLKTTRYTDYNIFKVVRTTKTQVILENGSKYRRDGIKIGSGDYSPSIYTLDEVTTDIVNQIKKQNHLIRLAQQVQDYNWDKIDPELLYHIAAGLGIPIPEVK